MVVADTGRARSPGHLARAGLYGAIAALLAGAAQADPLEIVVANVRGANGRVRVAACTAETFLQASCQVNGNAKAQAGEVVIKLDLPPGTWAIQAYLDEDENRAINRNFFGIPTEGLGFSNDAPFRFGPPDFADAAFRLGVGGGRIRLTLRYF